MKTVNIQLRHVSKAFEGKQIYDDFSETFPEGEIIGIMAPSGYGKTTLLRMLMGLITPDEGQILGIEGKKKSAVFQEHRLCENLTASANIRLVNPKLSQGETEAAMKAVGLSDCVHQPVRELSGGMRRRVAILRALLAEYDILYLDEPFQGLDWQTKELVMEDMKRRCQGKTVFFVTHDTAELEVMGAKLYPISDQCSGSIRKKDR